MEMIVFFIIGVFIVGLILLRKRVETNNDKYIKQLETSQQSSDDIFDDFMCFMLVDGVTIIRGKHFSARGNARGKIKQK